jgi:hypothetical protein
VVRSAKLCSGAKLTTPSAALRRLRDFLLMPQPPLLCEEGNVSQHSLSQDRVQPGVSRAADGKARAVTENGRVTIFGV